MNPTDIDTSELLDENTMFSRKVRPKVQLQRSFSKFFYDVDSFQHPFSEYFYNQMQTKNYDCIRLKDDLCDYNCHGNDTLHVIFNIDLLFEIEVPIHDKNKPMILEFCENIFNYLNN